MAQRGRQSAAARSMVATMTTLEQDTRPEPPEDLEPAEIKIWRDLVARMPADWFPIETLPLLEQYCKLVAGIKFIDKIIRNIEKSSNPDMDKWQKVSNIRRLDTQMIGILATKMRLTQQSSYNKANSYVAKKKSAKAAVAPAVPTHPWS